MKCYKCALKCHYSDKSSSFEAGSLQFYGPARLWLCTYSCQEFLFQNSRWRDKATVALRTDGRLQGTWEQSFGSQARKAATEHIQQIVCICGRAVNQLVFHDVRLDVLKLVVKLLLAAL